MGRILLAALLAAVATFIWGTLSWVVLPLHEASMFNLPEDAVNWEVMKEKMTEKGIYHFPGYPEGELTPQQQESAMEEMTRKYEIGPLIHLMIYDPNGGKIMMQSTIISLLKITFHFILLFGLQF